MGKGIHFLKPVYSVFKTRASCAAPSWRSLSVGRSVGWSVGRSLTHSSRSSPTGFLVPLRAGTTTPTPTADPLCHLNSTSSVAFSFTLRNKLHILVIQHSLEIAHIFAKPFDFND